MGRARQQDPRNAGDLQEAWGVVTGAGHLEGDADFWGGRAGLGPEDAGSTVTQSPASWASPQAANLP